MLGVDSGIRVLTRLDSCNNRHHFWYCKLVVILCNYRELHEIMTDTVNYTISVFSDEDWSY